MLGGADCQTVAGWPPEPHAHYGSGDATTTLLRLREEFFSEATDSRLLCCFRNDEAGTSRCLVTTIGF